MVKPTSLTWTHKSLGKFKRSKSPVIMYIGLYVSVWYRSTRERERERGLLEPLGDPFSQM